MIIKEKYKRLCFLLTCKVYEDKIRKKNTNIIVKVLAKLLTNVYKKY